MKNNPKAPGLSKCHNAPASVITGGEGTSYFRCGRCHKPCDVVQQVTEPNVNEPKDVSSPEKDVSDFSKFARADEATKRPVIERAIEQANQDQREAVQATVQGTVQGSPCVCCHGSGKLIIGDITAECSNCRPTPDTQPPKTEAIPDEEIGAPWCYQHEINHRCHHNSPTPDPTETTESNNVRLNVNSDQERLLKMIHGESVYDMTQVKLCKKCGMSKHVDQFGLCGRCSPDQQVEREPRPTYEPTDTSECTGHRREMVHQDELADRVAYSGDRKLIHKWLGGKSGEIIDRIDDMELLLDILKICERRRG